MWIYVLMIESPINKMFGLSFPFLVFGSGLFGVFLDIPTSELEALPSLQFQFASLTVTLC